MILRCWYTCRSLATRHIPHINFDSNAAPIIYILYIYSYHVKRIISAVLSTNLMESFNVARRQVLVLVDLSIIIIISSYEGCRAFINAVWCQGTNFPTTFFCAFSPSSSNTTTALWISRKGTWSDIVFDPSPLIHRHFLRHIWKKGLLLNLFKNHV